ncbi:MAG: hypothetical protein MMC33_006463 [Icmadophila ericetorum]|nr:hypothetical protein [Icmadophila ericetorum]
MNGAFNKAMPENRKATGQRSALKDHGKQSYRIRKQSPRLSVRKSARLQERRDRCIRHILANVGTKRIRPLPSPSASDTHSKEFSKPCSKANKSEKGKRERNWTEDSGQDHIESKPPVSQVFCRKRKQPQDIEDLAVPHTEEPAGKRRRSLQSDSEEPKTVAKDGNCHPVEFWARHQVWPPKSAEKDSNMSEQSPKKRSFSSSCAQGVREGQNPRSWSLAHEREMVKYHMVVDLFQNQTTISDNSKQLCTDLLSARYELPKDSLFEDDIYMAVFREARARNETRINRDITPLIAFR